MYAEEKILKWKRHGIGCYHTRCGKFWVLDNETIGYGRAWNLYAKDEAVTLCGEPDGVVDTFNTKWEAQERAEQLAEYLQTQRNGEAA